MPGDDEGVDRIIGTLLRAGVSVSASVVLAGGIWYLARFGASVPNYHVFRGEPEALCSVAKILSGAWEGPASLIQLGLLLLIATPVLRVAFSVAAFAIERDRLYVAITLIVLIILLGSLSGLLNPPL
jgi:uncharacterized membrane protein